MSRRTGARTYWCMDCNLYAVPGPYRQCPDCAGDKPFDWEEHAGLLTQHWPEPAPAPRALRPAKPLRPVHPIPAAADEVTKQPRVCVTP
jgi:hypothetical protein